MSVQGKEKISQPSIIPHAQHHLTRAHISDSALKVLDRLKEAGYVGLLVGGCVRDLLLGREPKDFDVVTDAKPEEIKRVFHSARLIGRRFRLAHVRVGRDIIEVATFRAAPAPDDGSGEAPDNNIFGTQEEDALRRDFTVNALYYDVGNNTVIDYVGGVNDLKQGLLRMIGDPASRYREDPVRMLRAVRFAAKLGLSIEAHTGAPISTQARQMLDVPPARLFEEVLKLFHGGAAAQTFELLRAYGLFRFIFPATDAVLDAGDNGFVRMLIPQALANTDARVAEDKPVTPAFLFAALLWEPVRTKMAARLAHGMHPLEALERAADDVLRDELKHVMIPRRFSVPTREIWSMQVRFERRAGQQPFRLLEHKRFRAAYDFLLLRAQSGEVNAELAEWWTRFQTVPDAERRVMTAAPAGKPGTGKKRRRRRRRSSNSSAPAP